MSDLFAPPSQQELANAAQPQSQGDLFAPPTEDELFAPPSATELEAAAAPPTKPSSAYVNPEEIEEIAARHGVSVEGLRGVAPLYGVQMPGTSKLSPEYAAGFVGRSVGLNVPQFLYKKSQPENVRAALDELQELADERKSGLETAAEVGVGIGAGLGLGRAAAGVLGAGSRALQLYDVAGLIASPAVQGAATSKEGEELKEGVKGAALGAGLGVAGYAIGKGARKLFGAPKKAELAAVKAGETAERAAEVGRNVETRVAEARAAEREGDDVFLKSVQEAPVKAPKEGERFGELILPAERSVDELEHYAKARGLGEDLQKAAAHYEEEVREFAKTLKSSKATDPTAVPPKLPVAKELIRDFRESQGVEELARRYDEYRTAKAAKSVFEGKLETELVRRLGVNPVRQAVERIIDGSHGARAMDARLGTSVERTLLDLSQQTNTYTRDLQKAIQGLNVLEDAVKKTNLDPEKLYDALDTGITAGFTPEQLGVFQAFRKKYDVLAEQLRAKGVPLEKRVNYVPKQMVPFVDAILRIEERLASLRRGGIDISRLSDDELSKLMHPETGNKQLQETVRGIEFLNHTDIQNAEQLRIESALASNPVTAGARAELTAGAAMARQGKLPDFLLEKDPRRLIVNWAQQNLKAANLAPGLSRLRNLRNIAHHAGEVESEQYLQRLLSDLTGRRGDTVAAWVNTKRDTFLLQAKHNLKQTQPGTLAHGFYRTLVNSPEILGTLYNQIYPTLLGLNPRQVVQNLMQPLMMTIPELGYGYGAGQLFRAYGRMLASPKATLQAAEKAGFVPAQWSTELRDALVSGIDRGAIQKFSQRSLDRWSQFAMYAFEKSEAVNRGSSFILGKQVAEDIFHGKTGVQRFLSSIPYGTRREILAAKASKNAAEVERLVTGYIINRTQFNYNRATMSEFGRSMGPLFSTFTKWPASVAGDIYSTLQRKGAASGGADLAKRYLGPLFAGMAVNSLVLGDKEEQSDTGAIAERLLFGKEHGPFRGFAAGSPLGSVEGMVTGRVFKGPLVSIVADPLAALVKGDPEELKKWATSLYKTWVPVLPAAQKFWTETLPAMEAVVTGSGENPYDVPKE